jgi:hypothetical protein
MPVALRASCDDRGPGHTLGDRVTPENHTSGTTSSVRSSSGAQVSGSLR